MKVIFLDIDGVLNSIDYVIKLNGLFDRPENQMDPEAVVRLNRITDATGAKLVISSTWRLPYLNLSLQTRDDSLARMIASYKVTGEVIGLTPRKFTSNRAQEIWMWLVDDGSEVENYIILDDDRIEDEVFDEVHVKTKVQTGLQDEHVEKSIRLLQEVQPRCKFPSPNGANE